MRKALIKGSKEAKAFMAKLRAKKASATKSIKNVATNVKRVAKGAKNAFREGYCAKDKVGAITSYAVIQYFEKHNDKFIIDVVPIKKYNLRKNTDYKRTRLLNILDTKKEANKEADRYYKFINQIGSTLLINKGENPRAKPTRVIQVDRTKKGAFKKFKTISGVKKHTDTKSHNISIKVGALPSYKDPDAAREIQLYADNDSQLYYQRRKPILINLSKKHKKGQYNIDKAAKLWRYYIDAAMQKYHKDFGGRGSWSNLLSVADRKVLANDYAINTLKEFELGNYTEK